MAGINQQQLIGSMIPDVYIKKISLESGGMTLKKENPHIRHPHENANKLATSNNDMNVRLDLSIKDMHDTGLVDTWFANQDYKKYAIKRLPDIKDIYKIDKWARRKTLEIINKKNR